ncbi:MAG: class I SAM-dependent methyltransferase [Gemmataceae bacterium]|nr:class I SAM-dependent methyltransferase [Gemmataceae bacterium]
MWDERYSQSGFAYGTEPNEFLALVAGQIPVGPVLSLGEGEGRNAAFLASLGHRVVAVDQSEVGLAKARRLAADRGLKIETVVADLASFPVERGVWAGIVSIFCHLPRRVRIPLYAAAVEGLRPGGVFVLEAYTPQQIGRGTGGPQDPDMLVSLAQLFEELAGLEFVHARELDCEVHEGAYHSGLASVVQVVGIRPGAVPG